MIPENKRIENYKIEHDFPKAGHRAMLLSARRLYQPSKGTQYVVIRFDDGAKAHEKA